MNGFFSSVSDILTMMGALLFALFCALVAVVAVVVCPVVSALLWWRDAKGGRHGKGKTSGN